MSYDVVVVGAGHAGLAASYYLKQEGISHIVLEKGLIGESWRSQRWDSFRLNTPNRLSHLPGDLYAGPDPDGFYHRDEFVTSLENYVRRFDLPAKTGVEVTKARALGGGFEVETLESGSERGSCRANSLIVATGLQNVPRIPTFASALPASIVQMHAAAYRNPDEIPGGASLVVGGGQSGFQIAEDLLENGRTVYFSSSRVARVRRRYRGVDILDWLIRVGVVKQRTLDLEDRSLIYEAIPHLSGVGPRGRSVSYQHLARDGATILGKLSGFENGRFIFDDDAADNVRFADMKSEEIKRGIDQFLSATGAVMAPVEYDERDEPDPDAACASDLTELHAEEAGIRSVIWCTGFRGDFSWIEPNVVGEDGRPVHRDGCSPVPGLFFLGFPWLINRGSGTIMGVEGDADAVVSQVIARLRGQHD